MASIDGISVNITVQDAKVTQAGFGIILILDEHTAFTDRTKSYAELTEVLADFAATTKVYKAANATFNQKPTVETLKVGRIDSGDANLTATMAAIVDQDSDFYGLISVSRVTADILELAAWTEANGKDFATCTEDADVPTSVTTDVLSVLAGFNYNRTFFMYNHNGGVDSATGNAITVTSEVATVTKIAHGLRLNDPVTFSGAIDFASDAAILNGNFIVASVVDDDNFTYSAPGAADGAATGTIVYFARYLFPDAAMLGERFPTDPGSGTWKFKTLAGQTATPKDLMGSNAKAIVLGKSGNVYTNVGGVDIVEEGWQVSGRYSDIVRGVDWLEARMTEAIFERNVNLEKVPYTNEGLTIYEGVITDILNQALAATVISPLSDESPFTITIPDVANIPKVTRGTRLVAGITFVAKVGDAVHGVVVTGTLEI